MSNSTPLNGRTVARCDPSAVEIAAFVRTLGWGLIGAQRLLQGGQQAEPADEFGPCPQWVDRPQVALGRIAIVEAHQEVHDPIIPMQHLRNIRHMADLRAE